MYNNDNWQVSTLNKNWTTKSYQTKFSFHLANLVFDGVYRIQSIKVINAPHWTNLVSNGIKCSIKWY